MSTVIKEASFKSKVLKGFFWLSIGTFSGQFISWISTIIVIRLLLPKDYGLMAMAGSVIAILTALGELGIGASIVQAERITEKEIRQIFGFVLVSSFVVWLICHLAAPLAAHFYKEKDLVSILRVLNINFILIGLYAVPQSLLIREMNFRSKTAVDVSAQIASSLTTLLLAWVGLGVWVLVAGTVVLNLVKAIGFNISSAVRYRPILDFRGAEKFIRFGITMTGSRLFFSLYNLSDTVILGRLQGQFFLGIYSVALNIASIPVEKVIPIVNQVSFTSYARIQDDTERVMRNVLRATRTVALTSFPIFFGMSSVAQEALPLILGPKWENIVVPFQLLCFVLPLKALSPIFGSAVFAIGKARVNLINSALTFVIMTAGFMIGARQGILGICIAWIVVYPAVFFITAVRSLKALKIPLKAYASEIMFPSFASMVMLLTIMVLKANLSVEIQPLVSVLILITSGCAIYLCLILIFRKDDYLKMKRLLKGEI